MAETTTQGPHDPAAPRTVGVKTAELVAAVQSTLGRHGGGTAEDRDAAALWLLQAELLGLPKFGIGMLRRELDRLDAPAAPYPPRGEFSSSTVATVDAAAIPGIVALARAVGLATATVAEHGTGVIAVRDLGATGIIGCAARSIALQGHIGIVVAESAPFVAPFGGTAAAIGTNPFAIAVPRGGGTPLVLDFATAPITIAELRGRAERGEALDPGIAIDRAGVPTIDPAEVAALVPGGLLPSLMGLVVQLLAGVAVGGASTSEREGLFAPRGAMVIAFQPPNEDVARACLRLVERWATAGGHVPGRLDRLPTRLADLPREIQVDPDTLDGLRGRGAAF